MYKVFKGENPNVKKYVFDFEDAIAEAVIYKYPDYQTRTVLCISIQSGCPVGGTFCGTGSKFIRNLTYKEIYTQVREVFKAEGIPESPDRLQIMFMSMGEPFLNYRELKLAITYLNLNYPRAELLVSTIGPNKPKELNDFIDLSIVNDTIGLQFSIHKAWEEERNELIPYKNKLSLLDLRNYGIEWWRATNRKVYLNYCIDGENNGLSDFRRLESIFPQNVFNFTFSVVCSHEKDGFSYRDLGAIRSFEKLFIGTGYDTRVFDPAGQDDIGGGCGQLWYVQDWMKTRR